MNTLMIRLKVKLFLIAFVWGTALNVYCQSGDVAIPEIDSLILKKIQDGAPGCVVGVIKNGEFIHKKAYGLANLDHDIPLTTSSVFRIASTSKHFTAAAIFLLEQQGKLSLEDDIRRYLEDFPSYGDVITIENLVHHTSGLRDYTGLTYLMGVQDDFQYTDDYLYHMIARQKELDFKPGTKFSYSNSGYFLLSRIVESVSGYSLNEFAKENLFGPLGMSNTHFHDNHKMVVKNRAYGYSYNGETFEISMSNNDIVGDGGIFTTLDDFRKWDQNFYSHQVGGAQLHSRMITTGKLNDGRDIPYAGGLYMRNYLGLKKITHTGWYAGFKSSFVQYPEEMVSIIILANNPELRPPVLSNQITNIILKEKLVRRESVNNSAPTRTSPEPETQEMPPLKMADALVGEYYSEELDFKYRFFKKDGLLYCTMGSNKLNQVRYVGERPMLDEYISLYPVWDGSTEVISAFTLSLGDSNNIRFERVNSQR